MEKFSEYCHANEKIYILEIQEFSPADQPDAK